MRKLRPAAPHCPCQCWLAAIAPPTCLAGFCGLRAVFVTCIPAALMASAFPPSLRSSLPQTAAEATMSSAPYLNPENPL